MRGNDFCMPDWFPRVEEGSRILVVGSSGGIGQALVNMLLHGSKCMIGAHYASARAKARTQQMKKVPNLFILKCALRARNPAKSWLRGLSVVSEVWKDW